MNCLYCQKKLNVTAIYYDFIVCSTCEVIYYTNYHVLHVKFERIINNQWWALNLFLDGPEHKIKTTLNGPGITYNFKRFINVTPQNVVDKIKLLILFS